MEGERRCRLDGFEGVAAKHGSLSSTAFRQSGSLDNQSVQQSFDNPLSYDSYDTSFYSPTELAYVPAVFW